MKRLAIHVLTAMFTFIIGLACGSVWTARQSSPRQETATQRSETTTREHGELSVPSDTFLTLERTGCYGSCPTYTLAVSADGTVVFSGSYANEKNGSYEWKRSGVIKSHISQEQVRQLIAEFEKAGYFSLRDSYQSAQDGCPTSWTDLPSANTSIQINGRKKSIEHYLGCTYTGDGIISYPKALTRLEERIDEIVNTKQWMQ